MTICATPIAPAAAKKQPANLRKIRRNALANKPLQMEFCFSFVPEATPECVEPIKKASRRKWAHIDTSMPLDAITERELVAAYQDGDRDAGGILVMAHQGLIRGMAKRNSRLGCAMEDLVAEANIGMCEAIQKFDPKEGTRLSTYAVWWIRQYLRKALTDARTIRIPTCQQPAVREIHATAAKLTEITGHYPSDEEIAYECGMSTLKVQNLRNLTVPMISLQTPIGNESGDRRTYEDILSDQTGSAESPLDSLTKKNGKESLLAIMARRLNPKEQQVVKGRFGINGNNPQTLEEVGNEMGLTRERVRQIQEKALEKLKRSLIAEQRQQPTLLTLPQFQG